MSAAGVRRITPKVKTVICEQAPNHGSYFAYARLIARVNSQFTSLMEREGISVLHDTDHGLTGIEYNLIAVVIIIPRRTVIGSLFPVDMNNTPVCEEPSVPCGVVTLERQIAFAQFLVKSILHQNIFKGQLLPGDGVDMRAVRTAGQMLGSVIESIILIEFKITSCRG